MWLLNREDLFPIVPVSSDHTKNGLMLMLMLGLRLRLGLGFHRVRDTVMVCVWIRVRSRLIDLLGFGFGLGVGFELRVRATLWRHICRVALPFIVAHRVEAARLAWVGLRVRVGF